MKSNFTFRRALLSFVLLVPNMFSCSRDKEIQNVQLERKNGSGINVVISGEGARELIAASYEIGKTLKSEGYIFEVNSSAGSLVIELSAADKQSISDLIHKVSLDKNIKVSIFKRE